MGTVRKDDKISELPTPTPLPHVFLMSNNKGQIAFLSRNLQEEGHSSRIYKICRETNLRMSFCSGLK
jgi:hypothetical protein